jgi:hypothetical protein
MNIITCIYIQNIIVILFCIVIFIIIIIYYPIYIYIYIYILKRLANQYVSLLIILNYEEYYFMNKIKIKM